ncbi:hypothetical protein SAMN05444372_10350 [Flavobacterium micromati]|uniref:Uncharacterized protein n=1 Tax=Flavobacterium micromati TaxID=229205 RepID=A0A1M5HNF0_9FLAO|nr:hypothetical protein [Flavobacterium micromati]SHG17470.1 hypothetical protein SAMN05444372_10350 [Flavobacterium micromati]
MENRVQERLEEIKKDGYVLDFSIVFNHAFENYKKIAVYGALIIFVFFVLITIIASIGLIAFFGATALLDFFKPENLKPEVLGFEMLLILSGVSILISSLLSPFPAALIKMAQCAENDEEFHVASMFKFYKAPYFVELFVATFIVAFVSSVISLLLNYFEIPFVNVMFTVFISLYTLLMIPLIIFGKLSAVESIKASALIVSKQPLIILALAVVGYIATLVGFIGCCVGIFFTIPFMYSLYYALYSEIVGFPTKNDNSPLQNIN